MAEFHAFPKIPRFNRPFVITEKIDGSNGVLTIDIGYKDFDAQDVNALSVYTDEGTFTLRAGSRKRWINPNQDNHGFAQWAWDNAKELALGLGEGTHYGEWWGSGINRGYGLRKGEKHFSLFNTVRWNLDNTPDCVSVVPVLSWGTSAADLHAEMSSTLGCLRKYGSIAAPEFMNPEGIVVYHKAGNHMYKATLEGDDLPKGLAS